MRILRKRQVATATLAMLLVASTAGCGDMLTGGSVQTSSYPPVSPLTSPEQGSVALPAGFPADVPVIAGRYRRIQSTAAGSSSSSYLLAVSEVGRDATARARNKLLAAGFQSQEFIGQTTYIGGSGHTVTLSTADDGFGVYLIYAVVKLAGMPSMPSVDLSELFGG
ncbi:hypothetical protein [Gordonia sp. CPCC 205333]|uniref:hypothetical protein n=1 Tax=Gordonia sp. CPCC 205333 TaxID=3140790 RepID=UPI003AF3C84F